VPETHAILFMHGGGHGQFAAVPLNLAGAGKEGCSADYIVNGTWGRRAAEEARKYVTVRLAAESDGSRLPPQSEWDLDPNASYRYICSNETVNGLEFHSMPAFDDGVPLVVDMSSDIATKRIDWARVGVAFACAPKNIGHAGLTLVVVRKDLLMGRVAQLQCPGVLTWRLSHDSGAMWNTPATFNVFTTCKVFHWMVRQGGIDEMELRANTKSAAFYAAIDESDGFYSTPCTHAPDRSRVNVPFNVCGGDPAATDAFLHAAYERNMVGFRTKTPFGTGAWLRASFYTGSTVEQAIELAAFLHAFADEWRGKAPLSPLPARAVFQQQQQPNKKREHSPAFEALPSTPTTASAMKGDVGGRESELDRARSPLLQLHKVPEIQNARIRNRIPGAKSLDSGLPLMHRFDMASITTVH